MVGANPLLPGLRGWRLCRAGDFPIAAADWSLRMRVRRRMAPFSSLLFSGGRRDCDRTDWRSLPFRPAVSDLVFVAVRHAGSDRVSALAVGSAGDFRIL